MNRYYHSGQFREEFESLRDKYKSIYQKQLQRILNKIPHDPTCQIPPLFDECLEYHTRTYIINGMFEALNWPLECTDGLPAFIPEAPIQSLERGTRRFLDYLGLSPNTQEPLIIVEAKRPKLNLPFSKNLTKTIVEGLGGENQESNLDLPFSKSLSETIVEGLRGKNLGKEWNEILTTLKDYINSTITQFKFSPKRVVITNGDWLIVFLNPEQSLANGNQDAGLVIVYTDAKEICRKSADVWEYLEYTNVVGKIGTRRFDIGELPFYIISKIKKISLGVKLIYSKAETHDKPRPLINILPIVLIALNDDTWIYVQRNNHRGFELPYKYEQLGDHFREVITYSSNLLAEVSRSLHLQIDLSPVSVHYEQERIFFDAFKGVNDITTSLNGDPQQFILVTGKTPHFLRDTPSVDNCKYHVWKNSQEEGVAALDGPIVMSSVFRPKSFFMDGQAHHCTHTIVFSAKASQLNLENRQRCGLRSNCDGAAFCEIIQIEEYLCCRACIYFEVCTKADFFCLPCLEV